MTHLFSAIAASMKESPDFDRIAFPGSPAHTDQTML